MKSVLLVLGLFFIKPTWSQAFKIKDTSSMVSVISFNRDTLYLVNEDIGYRICGSWHDVPKEERPVFIFKEKSWIIENKLKQK